MVGSPAVGVGLSVYSERDLSLQARGREYKEATKAEEQDALQQKKEQQRKKVPHIVKQTAAL